MLTCSPVKDILGAGNGTDNSLTSSLMLALGVGGFSGDDLLSSVRTRDGVSS